MKRILIISVCLSVILLISGIGFSQQGNVWTFGANARIDFGTNPPTVSTSSLSSYEGCASISDNSGNLIFYTDGISVWDNTNTLISNSLMGHWSAAQSGILVPEPGTTPGTVTNRYYIFSIPQLGGERARYSIYDANTHTLPTLNATLPDHATAGNTTEGITVARHCNGIDYWVITHEVGNNRLKAYQVTNSGVLAPVTTDIGPSVPTATSPAYINTACCMKMSPNNKRLAFVVRRTSVNLLDFNPSTGVFSNLVNVATGSGRDYYGVEFSPNSSVLYYTDVFTALFKYNISSGSTASLTNYGGTYSNLFAGLQLAPNGCIYMAKDGDSNMGNLNQTSLGRIDDPNNYATSTYTANGLVLAPGTGVKCGLPNIIPSLSASAISVSGDNTICSGESTLLTASGVPNFSWSPATSLSSSIGTEVIATPTTTTTYTISGTDNGCSVSTTYTVTVNQTPSITVSNNGPLCEGMTLNLTATGQSGNSYTWTGPNSFASGIQNPQLTNVTASQSGIYDVTVEAPNGCSASSSTTVTINSGTSSTLNPNGPFCADDSPVILSSVNPGGTWSGTGITNPSTGAFDPSLASIGNNTISYTTTGSCGGTTTATVVVNAVPTVTASSNSPVCEGTDLDLTSSSQGGTTFSWTGPNSFGSNIQSPQIVNATSVNAGTYTVTVSSNGCSSSASTTVTVIAGTSPAINPNGPFCADASPVILSSVNPGGTWSGSGITDPSTGTFDPSQAIIGDNVISYTTSGVCGGTASETIVVNSLPVPDFTASVTSGCSPLHVIFTNTTPESASISWDLGNGSVSSVNNPNTVYSDPGCYDVTLTVTDNNGCTGTTTYNSFVCVNTDPNPIAQFDIDGVDEPGIDSLLYFLNSSENAISFHWDFGDQSESTTMSPEHSYSAAGSYLIQLIAYNAGGCSDTAYASVTVRDDLIFYVPNTFTPNGNGVNELFFPVLTAGMDPDNVSFIIFDRWGQIVFESTNSSTGWNGTYNGEIVQDGTYVWKLQLKALKDARRFEYTGHVNVLH